MFIGTNSKMSITSIMRKCAKFGHNNGRFVIFAALLAFGSITTAPVSAAGYGNVLPHSENQTRSTIQTPHPDMQPGFTFDAVPAHALPYGVVRDDELASDGEYGIALQLTPLAAGREIRWETKSQAPVASSSDNTRPHVWVKIEPRSGNSRFFLAFVIALFTISATGVMLMWRQIGKPDEAERPGWERWRH